MLQGEANGVTVRFPELLPVAGWSVIKNKTPEKPGFFRSPNGTWYQRTISGDEALKIHKIINIQPVENP